MATNRINKDFSTESVWTKSPKAIDSILNSRLCKGQRITRLPHILQCQTKGTGTARHAHPQG